MAGKQWSRIGVYPAFMTRLESLIGVVSSSMIGHLQHRHSLSCFEFRPLCLSSTTVSGGAVLFHEEDKQGILCFLGVAWLVSPRLFSLSGVEQGRAEEQCASARQILSPRGNFTWPTAQSTNKASGDKKESLARCRPNFIPSSCGNSTRRGRLALAQWVTRRRCAPNRDKFYCRVAISLAWRWHKRVTRRNLVAQISPTPPIHMLQKKSTFQTLQNIQRNVGDSNRGQFFQPQYDNLSNRKSSLAIACIQD